MKNKEYYKKYYWKHRNKMLAQHKKYYEAHRNEISAYKKQWHETHRNEISAHKKLYYKEHRNELLAHHKKYYEVHRNEISVYYKQWCEQNKEKEKQRAKAWRESHIEQYHEIKRKSKFKRRSLGFIPLNKPFEGSEAHHICATFVIYIPKDMHQSINHNVWTGKNMDEINKLAWEWVKYEGET